MPQGRRPVLIMAADRSHYGCLVPTRLVDVLAGFAGGFAGGAIALVALVASWFTLNHTERQALEQRAFDEKQARRDRLSARQREVIEAFYVMMLDSLNALEAAELNQLDTACAGLHRRRLVATFVGPCHGASAADRGHVRSRIRYHRRVLQPLRVG